VTTIVGYYITGIVCVPLVIIAMMLINRWDTTWSELKDKLLLEATCLISVVTGIAGIATAGSGIGSAFIIGIISVPIPILGYFSSRFMKKKLLFIVSFREFDIVTNNDLNLQVLHPAIDALYCSLCYDHCKQCSARCLQLP
jgi:hypothetical protein